MSGGYVYEYVGPGFTIEKNIIKGMVKDLSTPAESVGEAVLNHLSNNLDFVGQIDADSGESTTFADMRENMIRCALWLQKQGITKDDVVAVCTHNRLDAYIPCFATFLVGAIYNPWHDEDTLKASRHFMNLTRPKAIFVSEGAVEKLMEAASLENHEPVFVVLGEHPDLTSLKDVLDSQTAEEVEGFQPESTKESQDVSMIFFSSGTTGLPKGVALPHLTLVTLICGSSVPMRNTVFLWYSPLCWISGTLFMIQTVMNCATRIIHSTLEPEETCQVIEKFKVPVNLFILPPHAVAYFLKAEVFRKYNFESLKAILTGGAKVTREILEEVKSNLPQVSLVQGYGMTEVGGAASIHRGQWKEIDSVGYVMPNLQLKIVDVETKKTLGPNQHGECYMKSPTQMVGYYNNPEATQAAIDEDGWIHSGDIAYYTEDGEILIVDRIKEVMKFRGCHISPTEIEDVLASHPGVLEVAVVSIPHELDLERPMAFVKKIPDVEVTEKELVEMTEELGKFKKLWGGVKFLKELPHTASGKVNRKEVKDMAKALFVLRSWPLFYEVK